VPLNIQSPAQIFTGISQSITSLYLRKPNQSPLSFVSGSMLGAIGNAVTAWLFYLQGQIAYVFGVTRAGTSTGADLTSWGADYGMSPARVPATYAFSPTAFALTTNSPTSVAYNVPCSAQSVNGLPPVGSGLILQDTSSPPTTAIQYVVVADPTNPAYNAGLNAYICPPGTTLLTITCQALLPGTAGNAAAGTIQKVITSGSPFTGVSQTADCLNGANQETDAALRLRQLRYVGSLSGSSAPSLQSRILAVQPGLTYTIAETPPAFNVTVDDGSGAIPNSTLVGILGVVNINRAVGTGPVSVNAPANVPIQIVITGTTAQSGFNIVAVRQALANAIVAFTNANGVGGANVANNYSPTLSLSYPGLLAVIGGFVGLGVNQGLLIPYTTVTINGGTASVPLSYSQLARTSAANVTVA